MHLTLEFTPEESSQLRERASLTGRKIDQYVKALVSEDLHNLPHQSTGQRSRESVLLETINQGFSPEFWKRFRALDRKRKKLIISEEELKELIAQTDQLEAANVERIKALIELSTHWQIDLDALMKKLGPLNGKNF